MLTRYWDRRQFIRVPVHGPAWWRSGSESGHCELVDLSPGGAGLRMSARKGARLTECVTVAIPLSPTETWLVSENARVVRQTIDADGVGCVGLVFEGEADEIGRVVGESLTELGFAPGA